MNDPLNASDPKVANHHWYPFLRYQEECQANGKEATVEEWMRSNGKLNARIQFEESKKVAAEKEASIAKEKANAAANKSNEDKDKSNNSSN